MDRGILELWRKYKGKAGKGVQLLKGMSNELNADSRLTRAIELGIVSVVQESLGKALLLRGITALIRENLLLLNKENYDQRVQILDLLLGKSQQSRLFCLDSELLELALKRGCPAHFRKIGAQLTKSGTSIPDLRVATREVVFSKDIKMWEMLLVSGFYKREWNDDLLQAAFISGNKDCIQSLLKLGADPTYGKKDWILKGLEDGLRSKHFVGVDDLFKFLIKKYKKEDLKRVVKDSNMNWTKQTRLLCQRELDKLEREEELREGMIQERDFL